LRATVEVSGMSELRPKARLFAFCNRLPLIGEVDDPVTATALLVFVAATLVAVAFPGLVFPRDHSARTHVLQVAAGILVVVGAYFSAVTLREARAHRHAERLIRIVEQLGNGSTAVRVAAVRLLQSIAFEEPAVPSAHATEEVVSRRRQAVV